jgi:hypothetical protein
VYGAKASRSDLWLIMRAKALGIINPEKAQASNKLAAIVKGGDPKAAP